MKYLFCSIPFLFFSFFALAQSPNIDSLILEIEQSPADTNKVDLYRDVASFYLITNLDSCFLFVEQGLSLSRKLDYTRGKIHHLNILGNYYERKTEYDKALQQYNEALDIAKEKNYPGGIANILNNIAIVYTRLGKYDEAIKLYFESLTAEEEQNNQKGIAEAYNNIGVIYYYQKDIHKTLHYFEKSIKIEEELGLTSVLKKGYNNMGALYNYQANYERAMYYYQKAYVLSKGLKDKQEMALNLNNIATAYSQLQQADSAKYYQQKSLDLRHEIGDFHGAAYSYHNLAAVYKKQGDVPTAESYYLKSIELSKEKKLKEIISETYRNLALLWKDEQNTDKAYDYLLLHLEAKDSLFSEQKFKAITEVESKYETTKKEKEILVKQAKIDAQNIKINQQNTQIITIVSVSIILLLIIFLLYNTQKQKIAQLKKEQELKEANTKIELHEKLLQQKLNISRDLHDNIGAQLTFVISSIDNLKYGFQLEPKMEEKLKYVSDFTGQTIHELRDTIWAMNKDAISFEDLKQRIQTFIAKAKNATENISFDLDSQKVPSDFVFESAVGINVYRIIQESVNNALKYAKASVIKVEITPINEQLIVKISDNGSGFDLQNTELGNGLLHMKKRAKEIKGTFDIESNKNSGTLVTFSLPFCYKDNS